MMPVRMRVKANNGTTSTPGIPTGATSTDNRITADGNFNLRLAKIRVLVSMHRHRD